MTDPEEFTARTGIELDDDNALDALAITPGVYAAWRAPRRGTANPERMDNPLWDWLIRTAVSAWSATKRFGGPASFDAGPAWCFDRFGCPAVQLPDRRVVFIAGEHEDHYDPDFYIYNDVVVRHLDGRIEIYGYPEDVFPPTDFHTATLTGEGIVLIGNLGYPAQRQAGVTQVVILEPDTWRIRPVPCTGEAPGWLHNHTAQLAADGQSITVTGGLVDPATDDDASLRENIDDWRLWLADWRWERLTRREWPRREFLRQDGSRLHLWELANCVTRLFESLGGLDFISPGSSDDCPDADQGEMRRMMEEMKQRDQATEDRLREQGMNVDRALFDSLFVPPVPHEKLAPDESDFGTKRISVEGITVRYSDRGDYSIQMTVEGELPTGMVELLTADLLDKLEQIQGAPCRVREL